MIGGTARITRGLVTLRAAISMQASFVLLPPALLPRPQTHPACAPGVSQGSYISRACSTSGSSRLLQQPHTFASPGAAVSPAPAPRKRRQRIAHVPRLQANAASAAAEFYAAEDAQYEDLGLHVSVAAALKQAGFGRPARIQELSSAPLMTGQNTVITAETGSGKTLAYIAPIASMLLRAKERQAHLERPVQYHALVLCPNGPLCQQVASVVNSLRSDQGEPLLSAAQVNSSNPPPPTPPDFILATPAGLMTLLNDAGPSYGRLWTPEGMQARLRHVVLDEADLLLTSAYSKPVTQILQMLRSGDRRRVEAKIYQELGIGEDVFERLPRKMQVAAWQGGSAALLEAGFKPKTPPAPDAKFGPYWKRQYVFVAATMPTITTSDVGSQIERLYPDAQWVATDSLHTSKPQITHTWVQVDDSNYDTQLLRAIQKDPDVKAGKGKLLVFARDTAAADEVSALLEKHGIRHVVYHKNRPMDDNRQALAAMQGSQQGIMVCTDAAARGIDIQDITHVVQADFAPNTIDFIHRIGRTGRADKAGKVTSLYREHNLPLVEVLRKFIEEGRPLEAAFSRARSFSRKFKRMGNQFVPRGMGPATYRGSIGDGSSEASTPQQQQQQQPASTQTL